MQNLQYTFRLFGARAGKSGMINGHQFVNGYYRTIVAPVQAATLCRVLSFYGAFAQGTPEHDAMLAQEDEANGGSKVPEAAGSGSPDAVRSDSGPDGTQPEEASADDGSGAADSEADGSGSDSAGSGRGHAGVPKFEEAASLPQPGEPVAVGNDDVKAAMLKLDPENDEHWVKHGSAKGLPKLNAVEEAYGKAGLGRQDLDAAMPGWNREKAIGAALEA